MIKREQIPRALSRLNQWVIWKSEPRDDTTTKVPHTPTGRRASSSDPTSWSALDDVLPPPTDGGVGFVFSKDDGLAGIDLDHCVSDGEIDPQAQNIIDEINSYTEYSPSGEGVHIICGGSLPPGRRRKGNVEMYDEGRYFTVTGDHVEGTPREVKNRTRELHQLHSRVFEGEEERPTATPTEPTNISDAELLQRIRDSEQGSKFNRLWSGDISGYPSQSEADLALCSILTWWTRGNKERTDTLFRQSGLYRDKWDRADYRQRTLDTALEGRTEFYDPTGRGVATATVAGKAMTAARKLERENGKPIKFWDINEDAGEVSIQQEELLDFLVHEGFGKTYDQDNLTSSLVRVENQTVRRTSAERIKDYVLHYARLHGGKRVSGKLIRGANVYFSSSRLECLRRLDLNFRRDTKDEAFFYYRNGFVKVTAESLQLKPYEELNGHIWEDQILDRNFKQLTYQDPMEWDWGRFLWNISAQDEHRHRALMSGIGYSLHDYKDPSCAKAIVLMDEKIDDVPDGRSGKSLTTRACSHMTPTIRIDARNFSFDSRFSFQSIRLEHHLVDFNDAPRRFDSERLFSMITDAMQIERKGREQVTIPFDRSPKFVITTNYIIQGEGASFEDRVFQIEIHPHYTKDHRPIDEFGRRFFDDWQAEHWHQFDNVMLACVSRYLRHGLYEYEHVNLKERKLRQETSVDFAEWIRDKEPGWYNKAALCNSFKEDYDGDYDDWLTQRKFTRWVNRYGRIFTGDKLPTRKSGSERYIQLPELDNE